MSRQLSRDLYHLMRKASRRTPVEKLRRKGHKNVSVLNFRDVQALIEKAVQNTLRSKGVNLNGPGIAEDVRMEFLALMRERDVLQDTVQSLLKERDELAENRQRLTAAIDRASDELHEEESADPVESAAELAQMSSHVSARLREILASGAPGDQLAEKAVALVEAAIEEQRLTTQDRAKEAHEERLSHLHRRIKRLKAKLGETEQMLARAKTTGAPEALPGEAIDPGLKIGDPNYEQKKDLLGEIFKLNVELREMLNTN